MYEILLDLPILDLHISFTFRLITLLSTTVLDVPFGLGLGILSAILSVILQGFVVKGHQLTPPKEDSDLYVPASIYECTVDSTVKVFRYDIDFILNGFA